MDTCETCRYWVRAISGDIGDGGECRRNPPTVFLISRRYESDYAVARHPPRQGGDWCGEFQSKKRLVGVQITPAGEQYFYSDS